jgi:cellulase
MACVKLTCLNFLLYCFIFLTSFGYFFAIITKMKSTFVSFLVVLTAQQVAGHSTFQELWVNGIDKQGTCVRTPPSNSPVTDVTSTTLRCNVGGATGVAGKCSVAAGQIVTVEMHAVCCLRISNEESKGVELTHDSVQQPGDRSCASEAIGGAHYGPVQVYMSKVSDASTADGSAGWFKVFADTWSPV